MQLQELQKIITDLANKKGWGNKPEDIIFGEKIALLHSEVSEMLEAYRKNNWHDRNSVGEEMADVLARILHLASIYNVDIEKELLAKLEIDKTRDWSDDQLYIDRDKRNNPK